MPLQNGSDVGAPPIVGQNVRYQTSGTHVIVGGIITGINTDGTVSITSFAAGSPTSRTNVARGSLDGGTATQDNRWDYGPGT